jgi:serralysin
MATRYISPTGAGDKSGSSAANAAPIGSLSAQIVKAGAGGEVLLIADAGVYKTTNIIPVSAGGTNGLPVTIRGVDQAGNPMAAEFTGTRPVDWHAGNATGNEMFKIGAGANHLVFQDIAVSNVGTAFRVSGDIAGLTIERVEVDNVRRFFENYASSGTATIDGLTIRDVDVTGFSRNAIRLQYDTHNVLIENVRGDMAGQVGDDLPAGIHLDGTVHDVVIRDTVMANVQSVGSGYLNGDGFATERGVYGVRFENTTAQGNSDGGYDLKSTDTVLDGVVSAENARNYRFWGEATMTGSVGLNPTWRGGSAEQNQIWVAAGARVSIADSAFTDAGSRTKVISSLGWLTLDGVKVVHAAEALLSTVDSLLTMIGLSKIAETIVGAAGDSSAGYVTSDAVLAAWIDAVVTGIVANTFVGTTGNDAYYIDSVGDTIVEYARGGTDHVATTLISYTLGTNLEQLSYAGGGDFTGVGNAAANVLNGGGGRDALSGLDGSDTLNGAAGDDLLQGGNGTDTLNGGDGADRLLGGWQSDTLFGDAGDDRLIGDVAWLSTVGARDTLQGGAGNDILFGDAETMGNGARGGDDRLLGGSGNDVIHGDAATTIGATVGGADGLFGEDGNDILYGDGAAMTGGIGGADRLDGGAGNDVLVGGGGKDVLIGGTGADRFVFAPGSGNDEILDFRAGQGDTIDLSAYGVAASAFAVTESSTGLTLHLAGGDTIFLRGVFALDPHDIVTV